MTFTTIISTGELAKHLTEPNWLIVDCRFQLSDPDEKERAYLKSHIPGAVYAHLNRDLSGRVLPGKTGRHPLPTPDEAARVFSSMGIDSSTQVVAYDDQGGALAAARLWLMLKYFGLENAAILDGGWQKWLLDHGSVNTGLENRPARDFSLHLQSQWLANQTQVERLRLDPEFQLIDVRAPERYRGEFEPIDTIGGHIPGAINIPYSLNLSENGVLKSSKELSELYGGLLERIPAENMVFYCGSGVTSALSVLAIQHIGRGVARIYPGSWSEWITDSALPRAMGA